MTTDAAGTCKQWHEQRPETVSAPFGPLAPTATHGIGDYPEGRFPDIPGVRVADGEGVVLTAAETGGRAVGGRPFPGAVRLAAHRVPEPESRAAAGGRRLVVPVREGPFPPPGTPETAVEAGAREPS